MKLSATRTRWPRRTSSSVRWEPMKPAPPVTRYDDMLSVSAKDEPAFALRASARQASESGPRKARNEPQRVLIVELPQDRVGQADPVQLPERVIVAVVVEVLVVGLEDAPVIRVFVRLVAVFAKENPILILHEELVRRARLPAEIVEDRRDVEVHVRIGIEQPACARE